MSFTPRNQAQRENTPVLPGKSRDWGLSAESLTSLARYANDKRVDPTEAEKLLWTKISRSQLDGRKFHRQAAIGPFITDFFCPQKGLIVEVDGDAHDVQAGLKRDAALNRLDFTVLRFGNADVMRNLDGVCERILHALEQAPDRWASPNPFPEGEGLLKFHAKTSDR